MSARFTIVLVVLLVLIGGLVAVTQLLRGPGSDAPERPERLYRIASEELMEVVISQGEDSIKFVEVEDTWYIRDDESGEDSEADIGRWGGITSLLGGPAAENLMKTEEDRTELGDRASYGLEPPRTVITLTTKNRQMVVINLGDLTPTEDGYYVEVEDIRDNLYIVHNSWGDVLERLLHEPPYPVEEG